MAIAIKRKRCRIILSEVSMIIGINYDYMQSNKFLG